MTPEEILANARKLKDERFAARNNQLKERAAERYNETKVEVPDAYAVTTEPHKSNIINDECRQVTTLVSSVPQPHLTPPTPEDQSATTKIERFLSAMLQELQDHYGPVLEQCTEAQVDDKIGWIFFCPKRVPYNGQPTPPADDATPDELVAYADKNTRYKRDAGISAVFDYEFAATGTVMPEGNPFDPKCVYVWKEVPVSTFKKAYGAMENITGYPESRGAETTVNVVEYWDAEECQIVAETKDVKWMGMRAVRGAYRLDSWKHNFGRVPYFARPAFVTKELAEEKKYSSPLDGIYNEMPSHKRLRTMMDAVAYQTAFAPMKITTTDKGETILDDSGNALTYVKPRPGEAMQLRPGQDIAPIGQSPEIAILANETLASQQRIERFTLSPVSKGISPGADSANAMISNLHRLQLSTLDPMAKQAARQARAMFRFALERIRDMQETVYVLERETDSYLSLNASEIVSVNVDAKALPDQGQQQLLIEKHAAEMKQLGLITLEQMYEMWGKENPEEWANAVRAGQLLDSMWPIIMQQMLTDLGMMQAIQQMSQAQEQTGDARNAVPGLMQQAQQMNGMGQGAEGQPRSPGVRMPTEDVNTQRMMAGGY